MKKLGVFLSVLLIAFTAYAAIDWEIPNNVMKMGDGSNATSKTFEMKMGLGASNPTLSSLDGTEMNVNIPFRVQGDVNVEGSANFQGDLSIGEGTSTDRTITVDRGASNPFLRWDESESSWVFSNDGTQSKKFGTGSGGGGGEGYNNAFTSDDNPNAEDGTVSWSFSGGVFVNDLIDPLEGEQSFTYAPAAQNDYVRGPLLNVDKDTFKGRACQAQIEYIGGDENLELRILDLSGAVYKSEPLRAHTITATESVFFLCPSANEILADANLAQLRLEIFNVGAVVSPLIKFDKSYLGTLIGLVESVTNGAVGDIIKTSSNSCSSGTLLADGSAISRSEYSELFSLIGTTYGAGDGSTTFNIPDYRGLFLRGAGSNATIVADGGALGNIQEDILKVHSHSVPAANAGGAGNQSGAIRAGGSLNTSFSTNTFGASETAPDRASVNICIRVISAVTKVYKSIPKVSENINISSALIDPTGNVISPDGDFIASVVNSSPGQYTIALNSSEYSVLPIISVSSSDDNSFASIDYVPTFPTIGNIVVSIRNSTTSPVNSYFTIRVQKQGADFKLPTVQPILVNQVETSVKSGVRVESCQLNSLGAITTESGLCESWVVSSTSGSAGQYSITHTGTWSKEPVCVCSISDSASGGSCTILGTNTSTIDYRLRDSSGSLGAAPSNIICSGAR